MPVALPIDALLPEIVAALEKSGRLVLQAPPGAGKTTKVPLAMLKARICAGKIVMLEPRRLAARMAAERMAQSLGEPLGKTVGYRIRGETTAGADTKIEMVTEGILTRMIQDTPDLRGIGAVIFDEFHERSLNADLGLALCLEVAEALRDDLMIVAMSATLDAAPVANLMQAPIVTSAGRSFDVTPHWLPKPVGHTHFDNGMTRLICQALAETDGSVLAFLPGEREIKRVHALIRPDLPPDVLVHHLFGAMPFDAQQRAIAPQRTGRKLVLATSIAETSLTIDGIRVVVDGGRARRSRFDPASGMSRLITEKITRAEATQRAGRAGRIARGDVYKLWTKGEDGALAAHPPPEIEVGDLSSLALELALWGAHAPHMPFLTQPHEGRLIEAQTLLKALSALDAEGRITSHGKRLGKIPLHPRLAHMVLSGGTRAPLLAALLSGRDPLRGSGIDLRTRMELLESSHVPTEHKAALALIKQEAKRIAKQSPPPRGPQDLGSLAALAYPDRVGLRRIGDAPRFLLSGGKGAIMPESNRLSKERLIVATDLDGDPREARIRQAVQIDEAKLRSLFSAQINWQRFCVWSRRAGRVLSREQERFGALVLDDRNWRNAPAEAVAHAMLDGVRQLGLLPEPAAQRFLARARLLRHALPDFSDIHLMNTLETWLLPHLTGIRSAADWRGFKLLPALQARLSWAEKTALDRDVPAHFSTPLGRKIPIDYAGERPSIAVRLQEIFGLTEHPIVAGQPLQFTLLSPGQKPVQITTDIPGFWARSYAEVRKDLRGRYPRHPWPDDPTVAAPTLRAKPRGT
ncbi:MAG: ATP-dependent helicase HrpB [Pseudomonadota bacterium]